MVRRVTGVLGSVFFALPLASLPAPDGMAWPLLALLATLAATSLIRPIVGLLILAGLFPVAPAIGVLYAQPLTGELLVLTFLSSACLQHALARRTGPGDLRYPATVLGSLLIAWAVLVLVSVQLRMPDATPLLDMAWQALTQDYFAPDGAVAPVADVMPWLEALALAAVAERIIRSTPGSGPAAIRMLVIGGIALSASSAVRLTEISLRQEDPLAAALDFAQRLRMNAYFTDINAAGSFYALFAAAAAWLTWQRSVLWGPPAALAALAVWLTGSRAAFGGIVGGVGLLWIVMWRPRFRTVAGAAVIGVLVLAAATMATRRNASVERAASFRVDLTRASFALAAERPVFGHGLNTFKGASAAALPERFKTQFKWAADGENAHNQFLQVLVELGVLGLAAFFWLVATPFRELRKHERVRRVPVEAMALLAGLAAFLLSALLGHPLLDQHIRTLFFLATGLAAGAAAPEPADAPPTGRALAWLMVLLVIAAMPMRLDAQRRMTPLAGVVRGAEPAPEPLDAVDYRVAARESTWYVAGEAREVDLTIRAASVACQVDVSIDGRAPERLQASNGWHTSTLPLAPLDAPQAWHRLDLLTSPAECTLLVGRPITR